MCATAPSNETGDRKLLANPVALDGAMVVCGERHNGKGCTNNDDSNGWSKVRPIAAALV